MSTIYVVYFEGEGHVTLKSNKVCDFEHFYRNCMCFYSLHS